MNVKSERAAVLAVSVAAVACYAWNIGRMQLHLYYGPGVHTMAGDWLAWLAGAYDPGLATTFDKAPGTFWLQALSARIFGYSPWAVLLPSLLASVAAVVLLYRIVGRWAGPWAGVAAAGFYAATPLVAALARTQIPDPVLVALLLAAVAAWQVAILDGRFAPLVWSGVFVGLAFQAKMAQAWLVFVPLGVSYLAFAPVGMASRIRRLAGAGLVAVGVSLVWVLPMALIPATARPWIDGSVDNSVWSMVFGYNGFNRYGVDNPGAEVLGVGGPAGRSEGPAWLYLFRDGVAPQVGWLYPLALVGLVVCWLTVGRTARALCLMWTLWLVVHAVGFAVSVKAHTFYNLALAPPLAVFAAVGLHRLAVSYREAGKAWLPVAVAATALWGWHVAGRFPGFASWLPSAVAVAGGAAVAISVVGMLGRRQVGNRTSELVRAEALVASGARPAGAAPPAVSWVSSEGPPPQDTARPLRTAAVAVSVAALLMAPVTWTVSVTDNLSVSDAHRPAAGPASRETASILSGRLPRMLPPGELDRIAAFARANAAGERYGIAVQWAPQAGQFMLRDVAALPIGGFTAQVPNVTPEQLQQWASSGKLRFALLDGPETKGKPTPDYVGYSEWVRRACTPIPDFNRPTYTLYDCRP